jgi:HK97 family phage prohead protease/HK97 family phage major capsid protein
MPIPQPQADESQSEFMARCMSDATMLEDYPEQDQRAGVCISSWNDSIKGEREWRVKTTAAPPPGDNPLEYVMSDASIDRVGDVIEPAGWMLDNFARNPIALFGHNANFPIGKWHDVRVKDARLVGRLELMDPVSDRLREVHAAIAAGVLRAVSVGFHPEEFKPLEGSRNGGLRFTKQELVECSVVSVPANPNALQIARALGISREGQDLIFGKPAEPDRSLVRRGFPGKPAVIETRKPQPMNHLGTQIQDKQTQIATLRDQLQTHIQTAGDNLDDASLSTSEDFSKRIEDSTKQLEQLLRAEKALGASGEMVTPHRAPPALTGDSRSSARPFAMAKREEKPAHLVFRSFALQLLAHVKKQPLEHILAERFGEDLETRTMTEWLTRSATVPATTTLTGWAAELVQTQIGEFFNILMSGAIYPGLSSRGFRVTLGRNGQISLPTRAATPTVAGSFVGEGAPIPVRQAAFAAITLGLKKMAVISTYTREIAEHSTPQIEAVLREIITDDTSISVDSVLIDANPATSVRPAGLRNGVGGLTPTAGGGFAALVGDIKLLLGVLVAANSLRAPTWIMNPIQAVSIALTANQGGEFPFKAEINGNTLQGFPVITSTTVPVTEIILVDAAAFMSTEGDDPRFEVSDQATLHMEDTTPLPISTTGAPNTVAAPVRSMFQTDSLALRMILPMNWAMRQTGVVAWMTGVTW